LPFGSENLPALSGPAMDVAAAIVGKAVTLAHSFGRSMRGFSRSRQGSRPPGAAGGGSSQTISSLTLRTSTAVRREASAY
jgi:hypothetical protein